MVNKPHPFLFQDEVRTKRVTRQKSTLEEVNNSVKVLNEMLAHFSPDDSTEGDKELIKVILKQIPLFVALSET